MAAHVFMGGTFDPIHNGHLRTALEIQQWLGVDYVNLMPSKRPVHREAPGCRAQDRLAMVELAVHNEPALRCDSREIDSDQASYSVYTLAGLRKELGANQPVCMVLGMDAFLGLDLWHCYEDIMSLCHIIVVARPGYALTPNKVVADLLKKHQATAREALLGKPHGHIVIHELTPLDISATDIRSLLQKGLSPRYLLPEAVLDYIEKMQLYKASD
jgi:nicotinate-nucleotide adenylyltransferase